MNELTVPPVPSMTPTQISKVFRWEAALAKLPQIPFKVEQFIHAGIYCRTLWMPADTILTGALIKIPTILIISGNVIVYVGDDRRVLIGYHPLPAEPNRKQVFVAAEDTTITMLFPTTTNDVKKAEEEFTDEWSRLTTRTQED